MWYPRKEPGRKETMDTLTTTATPYEPGTPVRLTFAYHRTTRDNYELCDRALITHECPIGHTYLDHHGYTVREDDGGPIVSLWHDGYEELAYRYNITRAAIPERN